IASIRNRAHTDAGGERTADDGSDKSPALIGAGGRSTAAQFAPASGGKHTASRKAGTDGRAIAHRHSSSYTPADTDTDADAECRFTGNVSRQPAACRSYARARERDQASSPKGNA